MTEKKPEPLSRQNAKAFIKAPDNEDFTLKYKGTESEAIRHIHNMRVQLSKMRNVVRNRGGAVKPFKMNLVSITEKRDEKDRIYCIVILSKKAPKQEIIDSVNEVLDDMTMGQRVDTGRN